MIFQFTPPPSFSQLLSWKQFFVMAFLLLFSHLSWSQESPVFELDCDNGAPSCGEWQDAVSQVSIPEFPGCLLTVEYQFRQCPFPAETQFRNWQIVSSSTIPSSDPTQAPLQCGFIDFFLTGTSLGDDEPISDEMIERLRNIEVQITRKIIEVSAIGFVATGGASSIRCDQNNFFQTNSFLRGSCEASCFGLRSDGDLLEPIFRNATCGPSCCPLIIKYCVDENGDIQVIEETRTATEAAEEAFCNDLYGEFTPAGIQVCPDIPGVQWLSTSPCFPSCDRND